MQYYKRDKAVVTPLISRIISWTNRRRRAHRLGIPYVFTRTFSIPESLNIKREKASKILLDYPAEEKNVQTGCFVKIFLDDEYWLSELANKKINNIIDCGANVGFFSIFAKIMFPSAIVHAYEIKSQCLF